MPLFTGNNQHPYRQAWYQSSRSILPGNSCYAKTSAAYSSATCFNNTVCPPTGFVKQLLCWQETPDLIPPTIWPPNTPDLNPVDYNVLSVMQEKVYKGRIKDIDKLCSRILTAWDELDQRFIDTAVRQWCLRLRACVQAKGGHFEHKLSH